MKLYILFVKFNKSFPQYINNFESESEVKSLSHVRLLATPWTVAHQAPPPIGFSRREYWSGVPLPSPKISQYTPNIKWLVFFKNGGQSIVADL